MIFVILFLFCARFVNSLESPSFISSSDKVSVNDNGTVSLECIVQNLGRKQLTWSRKLSGNELFIGVNEQSLLPDKYQLLKEGERKFVLKIKDVNVDDTGIYKCVVSVDSNNAISREIPLTVRTAPFINENTPSSITVRVNRSANFECNVTGNPLPKAIWTREDGGLLPNGNTMYEGSVLHIARVHKEHAGIYYCTGKNEVDQKKKTFKLQVEFEPEVEVEKKRVGQALQHKAELECKISAFPDPEISWYRGYNLIQNHESIYKVEKYTLPNAVSVTKLIITAVNNTQFGNYTCRAKNYLNEAQQSVEFYETHEEQCYPPTTCGSLFEYPDFKLIFSTTCLLVFVFRW